MTISLPTVVVFALAIVPGAFGTYVWRAFNGGDWHERDWEAALRFIAFSALGLGVYVLTGLWLRLPAPIHIIPATYGPDEFRVTSLASLFLPYFGHVFASGVVGGVAAALHRMVCRITDSSPHPGAWDHFIKAALPRRWAVVTLKSGDVFAGFIRNVEESAPAAERDVILSYPAKYERDIRSYRV